MKKSILVTGAAGFIGFHLARHLNARGDAVIGYDNFNDYYTPELKRARAQQLKEQGVAIIEGDICDTNALKAIVQKYQITHVAHLAAQAGVRYSIERPQAYVKTNLEGFVSVLEICRHHQLKLTYASSSSVYGLHANTPSSLADCTDRQVSLYGATKKANELMAYTYHHLYGIPVTGLRFFTVYGPWGRPDMAYFKFAEAITTGKSIDIYNHGHMQRDFTYIDDIIQGTVAAIDLEAAHEIFNLGHHQPEELLELIELLEKALGKKAKKNYLAMQAGDVLTTYADIAYSKEKLGFNPKMALSEGIPRFVEWYKEYTARDS